MHSKKLAKKTTKNETRMLRRQMREISALGLTIIFLVLATENSCCAFVPASRNRRQHQRLKSSRVTSNMVPQTKPYVVDQITKEDLLERKNPYQAPHENEKSTFTPTTRVEGFSVTTAGTSPVMEDGQPLLSSDDNTVEKEGHTKGDTSSLSDDETMERAEAAAEGELLSNSEAETIRNRQVALHRSGLLKKGPKSSNNRATAAERKTSVGDRRVGSATQTRRGLRRTSQLVDAVKQRAQGLSSGIKPVPMQDKGGKEKPNGNDNETKSRLSASRIQSTVEEMIRKKTSGQSTFQADRFAAAISSWGKSMGILGDETNPPKGEILSESSSLVVRVATPLDDVDIANLRLSVFSDFSADMRSQFCLRSCQALAHRRSNGAVCVVAKPPAHHARPLLLGSAECSHHEFQTTRLGRRRPPGSVLYITEVAVHPSARRQGIGIKLLEAMDLIAYQKEVETLYLHVDVSNDSAMGLYEKCGYQRTNSNDPMFQEFTTSLNLHPGATRGRTHYLLYKNIRVPTWVEEKSFIEETKVLGSLGFEVPA